MSIAKAPLRQTVVAAEGSRKRFVERRLFPSVASRWTRNQSSLLSIKWNPYWSESHDSAGTVVDFAEVRNSSAVAMIGDPDSAASGERTVTMTAAKTVQNLIDEWNAPNANNNVYWRAGLADVAPSVIVATGLVFSLAVALAIGVAVGIDPSP